MNYEDVNKIILKSFHEKKNSHAFLLCTNNINKALMNVKNILKQINCDSNGNDNCNICNTIDNNTNPDVMIIEPDGKEIKKDQILSIIDNFSTKPAISKYSTYIILNADMMNVSSANKLLKFLEEPEGNIIGIFITTKPNAILPTIRSRCEVYNYQIGNASILDLLEINEDEYGKYFPLTLDLTNRLNHEPKFMLMADAKNIAKKERYELDLIFKLLKKFYIIKYEYLQSGEYLNLDYVNNIINAIETEDINIIVNRIKIIDNILEDMNFNVNKELVINKFFLEWS